MQPERHATMVERRAEGARASIARGTKSPNPIDKYVGSRVRMRRMMINVSQEKLGEKLGITFQQVQKYEKGTNRIGASRLQQIATALNVTPGFFFQGAPTQDMAGEFATDLPDYVSVFLATPDGLALTKAFTKIADGKVRRRLVDLVEAIAAETAQ